MLEHLWVKIVAVLGTIITTAVLAWLGVQEAQGPSKEPPKGGVPTAHKEDLPQTLAAQPGMANPKVGARVDRPRVNAKVKSRATPARSVAQLRSDAIAATKEAEVFMTKEGLSGEDKTLIYYYTSRGQE